MSAEARASEDNARIFFFTFTLFRINFDKFAKSPFQKLLSGNNRL
jgi:hypothetical protein